MRIDSMNARHRLCRFVRTVLSSPESRRQSDPERMDARASDRSWLWTAKQFGREALGASALARGTAVSAATHLMLLSATVCAAVRRRCRASARTRCLRPGAAMSHTVDQAGVTAPKRWLPQAILVFPDSLHRHSTRVFERPATQHATVRLPGHFGSPHCWSRKCLRY